MNANNSNPAESKDYRRITNIITRAKSNPSKVLQHASNMAKAIQDPAKAWRRFNAAFECTDSRIPATIREGMARIFWVKATALNG